jgi:hypothetical protein
MIKKLAIYDGTLLGFDGYCKAQGSGQTAVTVMLFHQCPSLPR